MLQYGESINPLSSKFRRCIHALIAFASLTVAFAFANFSYADESAPNTLSDAEKAAGWKLLFDGQTTNGWRTAQEPNIAPGWKVENGAWCVARKAQAILSPPTNTAAFELSLEYNISPGGNSGLMYHVTEEGSPPGDTGPEIQIQDNTSCPRSPEAGLALSALQIRR